MLQQTTIGSRAVRPFPFDVDAKVEDEAETLWSAATRQTVAANRAIYSEGDRADRMFKVVSGAVRTFQLLEDGRRQVNAFYLAGEMFGLEAGESYHFCAEAITATQLLVVRREALKHRMASQPSLIGDLWRLTAFELERAQAHCVLLGRKSALERVASFLIQMNERTHGGNAIELPMSRQDIADFLGLTIETVSRTMTQLEDQKLIDMPSARHIVIRDRRPLAALDS
ncbi:helix-turn-helix domain-containing protein [Prosthecomicrobium pneumaticum]|uniref:CRP/FNR family nitrogen fixation transcriptional regulator n=1 Tax=Prosthecomicrobium pneumaticum TaxID=81895 RepID=A0A7W9FLQ1_9HYPH|nr:helix-turn-helix domain-containing protein [Prosthecomicrobium pneumaticum]MBB5752921.1 CRP/FNR family nitrogen fixation transcriptional regulator [Prosthecomicrobium pneumaticum]